MRRDQNFWVQAATHRFSRRSVFRAGAAGAGIAGLAAAGCGSTKKQAAPSSTSSSSSSSGAASNLKTGGTIQSFYVVPNAPLDPYENATYTTQYLAGYVYSRLFRYKAGTDPSIGTSFQTDSDLVQSYETPDQTTYRMKLRTDAMFHPPLNRALTSADVMASWQRFTTDPKNTNGKVFVPIVDSLTAPDDQTLVFKLKAPYAPFLNRMANSAYFWIMPKDAAGGSIDPSTQMVGTGPWTFVDRTATAYTFKKNPNYFIKGIPYADGFVYNVIPQVANQEAQFQAGKLDYLDVPTPDLASMQKSLPQAKTVSFLTNLLRFIFFTRMDAPNNPFTDVRLRRAVSLAMDRQGLLDVIFDGKGQFSNLVNPGMGKWSLDPTGKDIGSAGQWFKHDPQQAKQLLSAAGHTDTQFKYIYANNAYGDQFNSSADAVRGMLADAGFKMQVVTVDYLKDYINNGQGIFFKGAPANSIVCALETPLYDPDDNLSGMLTPEGDRNHEGVNDTDLTNLIAKERQEIDNDKRLQLVYQAQQMQDDKMYYPPLVAATTFTMLQPWTQNYYIVANYAYGTERAPYISLNK
jgi:peptide/nickel transport system substrate-binding protein